MENAAELKEQIDKEIGNLTSKSAQIAESIEVVHNHLLHKLEEIKDNEILTAIRQLNTRLSAIEARLPEPEEE